MVGIDGNITEFRYDIGDADSEGNTITAKLYKNNEPTSFTCSVTSGVAVSCEVIDSLSVTKGDLLAVADVTTAGGNFDVNSRHAYVIITS